MDEYDDDLRDLIAGPFAHEELDDDLQYQRELEVLKRRAQFRLVKGGKYDEGSNNSLNSSRSTNRSSGEG